MRIQGILRKTIVLPLVIGIWMMSAAPVMAGAMSVKTGDEAWDAFCQLKRDWIVSLHEIVVSTKPELKKAADSVLQWRLVEIDYDTRRFKFIYENHPNLIIRDKGLPEFLSLDWFPEFSKVLQKKDPAFIPMQKDVQRLKQASESSKRAKELEEYIRELSRQEQYQPKFKRFYSDMARVQRILSLSAPLSDSDMQ